MRAARPLALATALVSLLGVVCEDFTLSDEEYYAMPALFALDDYEACLARRSLYCLGSFELSAAAAAADADADDANTDAAHHPLYHTMQRFSSNWADHFNHTRLHRGWCVSERCPLPPASAALPAPDAPDAPDAHAAWFASCVNASTMSAYNLSARLLSLDYCQVAGAGADERPLSGNERAFAAALAALLALVAVSTALDLTVPDLAQKGASWALVFSAARGWRTLRAPPPAAAGADLRAFDGLRVFCMMVVIVEHVCWITTHSYLADTRRVEQTRRATDAMLMANGSLVVQIFFLMSSFLLAHKLLQQQRRGQHIAPISTFFETMFNRIIRISPSYFMVVWFATSWWERLGRGPMWAPLVGTEAAICRRKWWTHLLYLNNVVDADDKCLIQTWYLAADMQLYAVSLALTLALQRLRRGVLPTLAALLAASLALLAALAYSWRLVPTFVMHNPESVRSSYRDGSSFNVLYQSPLANVPGALAGLLLAHAHHALRDRHVALADYRVFRWASVAAVPLAVWWVAASPRLVDGAGGARGAAAALAVLERPVFAAFVTLALLGAIHGIPSAVGRVLSWPGWAAWARLSFGALLLHMPLNKALVAARPAPTQLDRPSAIVEWFGVAAVSYAAALPLALAVELPAQRLHRALRSLARPRAPPEKEHPQKADL